MRLLPTQFSLTGKAPKDSKAQRPLRTPFASCKEVKLQHHTLNPFVPDTTVIRVESLQELDRVYRFGLMGSGAKNSKAKAHDAWKVWKKTRPR